MVNRRRSSRRKAGTVRAICGTLGYGSRVPDDRYYTRLKTPVLVFCKQYSDSLPRSVDFCGTHAPDTLQCVTAFLEQHQHLFPDTPMAREFQWPSYAQHSDKIRKNLARLIYAQACNQKRNKTVVPKARAQNPNIPRANAPSPPPDASSNRTNNNVNNTVECSTKNSTSIPQTEIRTPRFNIERRMQSMPPTTVSNINEGVSSTIFNNTPKAPIAPMYGAITPLYSPLPEPRGDTRSTQASTSPHVSSRTPTLSPNPQDPTHGEICGVRDVAHGHMPPSVELDISSPRQPTRPIHNMNAPNTPPTTSTILKPDRSLWLALQGPKGDIETSPDKLVPETTFRASTLTEFFKLVATRLGHSLTTLAFITFRCTWGGRTPIVVNRYMTEVQWNDIKENDILERYIMERETNSKRNVFRVWVSCGDTSKLCE